MDDRLQVLFVVNSFLLNHNTWMDDRLQVLFVTIPAERAPSVVCGQLTFEPQYLDDKLQVLFVVR